MTASLGRSPRPNIISFAMTISSVNPATGETIATFEVLSAVDIEQRLQRAADAFVINRKRSFAERAARLRRAADILDARAAALARTITIEMGKPIKASVAEVQKCAMVSRHYADHAEGYLAEEHVATNARSSYVRFDPLGAILAVMPWNFPFWQVFRFAAPALMAGNVGLLKHASNVPQCALAMPLASDHQARARANGAIDLLGDVGHDLRRRQRPDLR